MIWRIVKNSHTDISDIESSMSIARILILVWWSFAIIFLFCEPGHRVATSFEEIEKEISECNWYSFSLEVQQMLVIFLVNAQQPTTVNGFANTECTREFMKKAIHP